MKLSMKQDDRLSMNPNGCGRANAYTRGANANR